MDVARLAVSVKETARYSLPKEKVWGRFWQAQAIWTNGANGPVLWSLYSSQPSNYEFDIREWDLRSGVIVDHPFVPSTTEDDMSIMPFVENSQPHFMATVKRGSHDPATTDSEGNEISPWSLALLRIYGPDGHEEREFAVDASKDIHPLESHSPLENYASSGILFPLHQTIEVKLTGTTRLARTYMRFNLSTGAQSTLDDVVKRAQGANLSAWSDLKNWYFFYENSTNGSPETTICSNFATVTIPAWQAPDNEGSPPKALVISDGFPGISYNDSLLVFCNEGETTKGKRLIAALKLTGSDLTSSNPTVVWSCELPDIFDNSQVVMDGVEKRPFLVALDSTNGNLTVLDPLLGTICAETTVKIASTPNPDLLGAKICFQTPESGGSNAAGQPSLVYILDPSTNQVIELTLSFSTPGSHSGIVPVDDSR